MTTKEAAAILDVLPRTIRRYIRHSILEAKLTWRGWNVNGHDVQRLRRLREQGHTGYMRAV